MKLFRNANWYNPFFVTVNGKPYELSNIRVFDSDGVIIESGHGWFGSGNNPLDEVEIPGKCTRKTKLGFEKKHCFVMRDDSDFYRRTNERRFILYIPADLIGLSEAIFKKKRPGLFSEYRDTNIPGVRFEKTHYCDQKLSSLKSKFRELCAEVNDKSYRLDFYNLKSYIPTMEMLLDQIHEEEIRLERMTVSDLVGEYATK